MGGQKLSDFDHIWYRDYLGLHLEAKGRAPKYLTSTLILVDKLNLISSPSVRLLLTSWKKVFKPPLGLPGVGYLCFTVLLAVV